MGHDKLRKFAENETFACLLQPSAQELLADGYFNLRDHEVKGHWNEKMFAKPQPIVLELGCGKGEYTIDLAQRNPQFNYIGVDIKGARLWKGAKYAHEHSLGNVAFLRTRIEFITAFFAPGEVSEIWLTFSDPQMKSENSRLSSPLFLERYRSFMRSGGIVHLKTDSRFLHEYTKAVCTANSLALLACTADLYGTSRDSLFAGSGCCPAGSQPAADPSHLTMGPSLLRAEGGTSLQGSTGTLPVPETRDGSMTVAAESGDLSEAKPASAGRPGRDFLGAGMMAAEPEAGSENSATLGLEGGPRSGGVVADDVFGTGLPGSGLSRDAVDALYEVQTFYERMFLQQGYKITYLSFIIDHEGEYLHPEFDEEYWREVEGPRRSFDHQPTKGHKPE